MNSTVPLAALPAEPGSLQARIESKPKGSPFGSNDTGILLEKGRRYHFVAEAPQGLSDGNPPFQIKLNNLDGWDLILYKPLTFLKREPCEPFFTLIGTIDGKHPFRIRQGMYFTTPASGHLICYFNDCWFMYWNNHGHADLHVKLTHPPFRKVNATALEAAQRARLSPASKAGVSSKKQLGENRSTAKEREVEQLELF